VVEEIATREAYGKTLAELGETHPEIVVLDADLAKSTKSAEFKKKFPERFFDLGIAEADMIGTAAGLASCGKKVFASSFAVFATGRTYDQIRIAIAYSGMPVVVCGSHAGLATGEDGASHQALEDIALMRALPNMNVIVPADAIETKQVVEKIMEFDKPVYLRTCRLKAPVLFDESYAFEIGKGNIVRNGKDVAVIACGIEVSEALKAAEKLEKEGISTRVINMASVKPIDVELVIEAARECGAIVTAEDHSIIGGLGSAVAEVLAEKHPCWIERVGIRDVFGESGNPKELAEKFGIDSKGIINSVKKSLSKTEGKK